MDTGVSTFISVIDTEAALQEVLDKIENLPTKPPSLYIKVEGGNFSERMSASIITIHVQPLARTYLIDVWKLGKDNFFALVTNQNQTSLKTILESQTIPKVFFDVRDDSDTLFRLYGIELQCIKDIQVMELAARLEPPQDILTSLTGCIENSNLLLPHSLQLWKDIEASVESFKDKDGRWNYLSINERPIPQAVIQYCVQNVTLLPKLLERYHLKLCVPGNGFWRYMIFTSVQNRLRDTQDSSYDPKSNDKNQGWKDQYVEDERKEWDWDFKNEIATGKAVFDQRFIKCLDFY